MNRLFVHVLALMLLSSCGGNQSNSGSVKNSEGQAKTADQGQATYTKYCLACHQSNGSGVPGMYPPLKGSDRLADKSGMINIVLHGLNGPIVVNGQPYNQIMPKQDFLSNKEIAEVLTYIRREMGGLTDSVSIQDVNKLRK